MSEFDDLARWVETLTPAQLVEVAGLDGDDAKQMLAAMDPANWPAGQPDVLELEEQPGVWAVIERVRAGLSPFVEDEAVLARLARIMSSGS